MKKIKFPVITWLLFCVQSAVWAQIPKSGVYHLERQNSNGEKIREGFLACINSIGGSSTDVNVKLKHLPKLTNFVIKSAIVSINTKTVKILFIADSLQLAKYNQKQIEDNPYYESDHNSLNSLLTFERTGKRKDSLVFMQDYDSYQLIDTRYNNYKFDFWKGMYREILESHFSITGIKRIFPDTNYGSVSRTTSYEENEIWGKDTLQRTRMIDECEVVFEQFKWDSSNYESHFIDILKNNQEEPIYIYESRNRKSKISGKCLRNEYICILKKYKNGWAKVERYTAFDSKKTDVYYFGRIITQSLRKVVGYTKLKSLEIN